MSNAGVAVALGHWGRQTSGLGEMQQILWAGFRPRCRNLHDHCDDVVSARRAGTKYPRHVKKFPDGIFLAVRSIRDVRHLHVSDFGRRWLETLQQIFPGHFPYWYDDRWVHQIGEMAGCYIRLPIVMPPIRGKGRTRRMRDLPFWARFFQLCLDERKASARKLIDAMNLTPKKKMPR